MSDNERALWVIMAAMLVSGVVLALVQFCGWIFAREVNVLTLGFNTGMFAAAGAAGFALYVASLRRKLATAKVGG